MTLILGMAKADGIYMSTDFRITHYPSGDLVDDGTIKFLTVHYPPQEGGPKALIAYSGLAFYRDGTPTGTWIRETLRGETEVIDASMQLLRERLDRDYGPLGHPLTIRVMVIEYKRGELGERRLIGRLSNVADLRKFAYEMSEAPEPVAFADGSGRPKVAASADVELLRSQLTVKPRSPTDHMGLLAAVNQRAAGVATTVSPFCHVSFIPADQSASPQSRYYTEPGDPDLPFEMPSLLFGLDLTDFMRDFQTRMQIWRDAGSPEGDLPGPPRNDDEINEGLKRRP